MFETKFVEKIETYFIFIDFFKKKRAIYVLV